MFGQEPSNAVAGVAISPAITVMVEDPFGDIQTGDTTSVTLVISANPGSGTLSGTLTQPVVNGVATFSDLSINKAGVGYVLSALDGLYGAGTSSTFNITPSGREPSGLPWPAEHRSGGSGDQPGGKGAGTRSVQQLGYHRHVQRDGGHRHQTGGGTLSGTTTVAAVGGVATFSNLSINKAGTGYTLTAADGSLGGSSSTSLQHHPSGGEPAGLPASQHSAAGVAISPAVTCRCSTCSTTWSPPTPPT